VDREDLVVVGPVEDLAAQVDQGGRAAKVVHPSVLEAQMAVQVVTQEGLHLPGHQVADRMLPVQAEHPNLPAAQPILEITLQ